MTAEDLDAQMTLYQAEKAGLDLEEVKKELQEKKLKQRASKLDDEMDDYFAKKGEEGDKKDAEEKAAEAPTESK